MFSWQALTLPARFFRHGSVLWPARVLERRLLVRELLAVRVSAGLSYPVKVGRRDERVAGRTQHHRANAQQA
jgi:hypothetical protein